MLNKERNWKRKKARKSKKARKGGSENDFTLKADEKMTLKVGFQESMRLLPQRVRGDELDSARGGERGFAIKEAFFVQERL